MNHDFSDIKK